MSAVAVLSLVLAPTFFVLGGWTLTQWLRWRRRSAAYLAVAFCSLALAIAVSRVHTLTVIDVSWSWLLRALNIALFAFPWLLAASVWSLEGRRPRWAWLGAVARPRMRLMAVGLPVLTAALLFDLATRGSGSAVAAVIMNAVAVLAGATFLFGFLPPRSLRAFWRRGSVAAFQRVQTALLGAVSRRDVAEAVAGPLAELMGTGVLVVDEDATVLDQQGVGETAVSEIVARLRERQPLGPDVRSTSKRAQLLVDAMMELGSEVEVVVADNGVGITPADEERIFTPFQRGTTAQGVGNGPGLVRRIVDNLGGRLNLEASETGARFVLRLPSDPVRLLASEHERPLPG